MRVAQDLIRVGHRPSFGSRSTMIVMSFAAPGQRSARSTNLQTEWTATGAGAHRLPMDTVERSGITRYARRSSPDHEPGPRSDHEPHFDPWR